MTTVQPKAVSGVLHVCPKKPGTDTDGGTVKLIPKAPARKRPAKPRFGPVRKR